MVGDASAPAWVLVVVSLASGAFGAVAASWLTARHERWERHRDRLIAAADDCITTTNAFLKTTAGVRNAAQEATSEEAVEKAVKQVGEAGDVAVGVFARAKLLFGPESAVGLTLARLLSVLSELDADTKAKDPDPEVIQEGISAAAAVLDGEFVEVVYLAVRPSRRM